MQLIIHCNYFRRLASKILVKVISEDRNTASFVETKLERLISGSVTCCVYF